jgi:hypothetical protein
VATLTALRVNTHVVVIDTKLLVELEFNFHRQLMLLTRSVVNSAGVWHVVHVVCLRAVASFAYDA